MLLANIISPRDPGQHPITDKAQRRQASAVASLLLHVPASGRRADIRDNWQALLDGSHELWQRDVERACKDVVQWYLHNFYRAVSVCCALHGSGSKSRLSTVDSSESTVVAWLCARRCAIWGDRVV